MKWNGMKRNELDEWMSELDEPMNEWNDEGMGWIGWMGWRMKDEVKWKIIETKSIITEYELVNII